MLKMMNANTSSPIFADARRLVGIFLSLPIFLWGGISPAFSAEVLDDSLSPQQTVNVQLQWTHQGDLSDLSRKEFLNITAKAPDIEVRLNTSNYIGQYARIFLALPVQINGLIGSDGLRLSWKTRGFFSAGTTTPGNRSLIFEGRIDTPILNDFFSFTINLDASRLNGNLRYAPIYEIEVE